MLAAARLDSFTLLMYLCKDPKIDEATQEPENCRDKIALGECDTSSLHNVQAKLQQV